MDLDFVIKDVYVDPDSPIVEYYIDGCLANELLFRNTREFHIFRNTKTKDAWGDVIEFGEWHDISPKLAQEIYKQAVCKKGRQRR